MRKHVGGRGYVIVWLALLVFTTLSFGVSYLNLPIGWDLAAALAIAAAKTLLVLFFFMHLIEQRAANRLVVAVSMILVVLLISLTAADVATRHTFPVGPEQ
jgi:cytochrome c oxidase subunit IV